MAAAASRVARAACAVAVLLAAATTTAADDRAAVSTGDPAQPGQQAQNTAAAAVHADAARGQAPPSRPDISPGWAWPLREVHPRLPHILHERLSPATCGGWMAPYMELHAAVLDGAAPPHFTVMRSDFSGLGDRLTATLSAFLHALVSGRAFLYNWRAHERRAPHVLWRALQSAWVDWRHPENFPGKACDQAIAHAIAGGT